MKIDVHIFQSNVGKDVRVKEKQNKCTHKSGWLFILPNKRCFFPHDEIECNLWEQDDYHYRKKIAEGYLTIGLGVYVQSDIR